MSNYTVLTVPGPRGINRITVLRNGEPLGPLPPARARPSAIPTTAAAMAAHFRTGRSSPVPRRASVVPANDTPPVIGSDAIALRERTGLTQRQAAEGAGVSRGMVGELETPRRRRFTKGASPQAARYLAWLRAQIVIKDATSGAKEVGA